MTAGSVVRLATNCVKGPVRYKGTGMSLTCEKYFHVMRPLFYTTSDRSNATAKFQAKKQLSPISKIFNIVHKLVKSCPGPYKGQAWETDLAGQPIAKSCSFSSKSKIRLLNWVSNI